MAADRAAGEERTIRLEFFAQFREDRGLPEETLQTKSATPAELYAELDARYHFRTKKPQTRVAVNDRLASWEAELSSGDTVVFLSPFGGG